MKHSILLPLKAFIRANQRICNAIEPLLPHSRTNLFGLYIDTVSKRMNAKREQLIVDVGGGKSCPFSKYRLPELHTRIVCIDMSGDEMRHNNDVDEKRVADITRELPLEKGEADLVVSRSVLEHLLDVENFIELSAKGIKPGGHFIHLVPSRFAPFALINQLLPDAISRRILFFLRPESVGIGGYPAHYNACWHSALARLLPKHGFTVETIEVSFYQSEYFAFFVPFYLASALYELAVWKLGLKNLCAYLLVVAVRNE